MTQKKGDEPKGSARPEAKLRAWSGVAKVPGANPKFASRQKLPSGPLGGSGRKTNRSRSS